MVKKQQQRERAQSAGVVLSSMGRASKHSRVSWERRLAGPEGWRRCGAVERCVWRRMDPRDATRPCMQTRKMRDLHNNHPLCLLSYTSRAHPCTHLRAQASSSRALEAYKVTLGARMHECSAARRDTSHPSHPLPALPAQLEQASPANTPRNSEPADRYRQGTFSAYRGYI